MSIRPQQTDDAPSVALAWQIFCQSTQPEKGHEEQILKRCFYAAFHLGLETVYMLHKTQGNQSGQAAVTSLINECKAYAARLQAGLEDAG